MFEPHSNVMFATCNLRSGKVLVRLHLERQSLRSTQAAPALCGDSGEVQRDRISQTKLSGVVGQNAAFVALAG